jgi:hypothetical protein
MYVYVLLVVSFLSAFPPKHYTYFSSPMSATCQANFNLFDLIIRITFGEEYKIWSSSLYTNITTLSIIICSVIDMFQTDIKMDVWKHFTLLQNTEWLEQTTNRQQTTKEVNMTLGNNIHSPTKMQFADVNVTLKIFRSISWKTKQNLQLPFLRVWHRNIFRNKWTIFTMSDAIVIPQKQSKAYTLKQGGIAPRHSWSG